MIDTVRPAAQLSHRPFARPSFILTQAFHLGVLLLDFVPSMFPTDMTSTTRPLPQLPAEIWAQIASHLPWVGEPIWVPWQTYRLVSRTFKDTIEGFYIAHVLNDMRVCAEATSDMFPHIPGTEDRPRTRGLYAEYWFDGFHDMNGRKAVLRGGTERCRGLTASGANAWRFRNLVNMLEGIVNLLHDGCGAHSCLFVSLGRIETVGQGFTDMLPMDLTYPTPSNPSTFTFDWRTYLTSVFHEMWQIVDYQNLFGVTQLNNLPSGSAYNLPTKACALYRNTEMVDWHRGFDQHKVLIELMKIANTSQIGMDGRLTRLRRQRRRRHREKCIADKLSGKPHEGCAYNIPPCPQDTHTQDGLPSPRLQAYVLRERQMDEYVIGDEERMAEKLSIYQETVEQQGLLWNL